MATSLKSSLPVIARILGEKETTLYERQRALVREGLLHSAEGHGPGSGVRATPESMAVLLIGMLATVSLSEVGQYARSIAKAVPGGGKCPLTGAGTFQGALTALLTDARLAERIDEIRVLINGGYATIQHDKGTPTVFMAKKHRAAGLRIEASIVSETLCKLADVVRESVP